MLGADRQVQPAAGRRRKEKLRIAYRAKQGETTERLILSWDVPAPRVMSFKEFIRKIGVATDPLQLNYPLPW